MDAPPIPLWLECYVLELPFDCGVPDNYILHVKDDAALPVEPGWEGFALGSFLGFSPEPPTAQMQSTTLVFRRAAIPTTTSIDAMVAAFPEILRDAQRAHPWWRQVWLRTPLHRGVVHLLRPPKHPRTVIAATRIAVPPNSVQDESPWRGSQLTICLRVLNEYFESLAEVRTNLAVGPLAAPDLQPLLFGYRRRLPNAATVANSPNEHFAVVLHEYLPWVTEPLTWQQAQRAEAGSLGHDQPFFQAASYLRNAERSLMQENTRHAIIDACTAIELAVSDTVRVFAPRAGYDVTTISNVLDGRFANRVRDHFARLLAFSDDPATASDILGIWWRDGYLLRNLVAHRGHRATRAEAGNAVVAGEMLLDEVIARLTADDRFADLLPSHGD
jgi:hypothetical protein